MSDTNKPNSCGQKPCVSRTYERSDSDNVNAELRGRPILYTGVVWIGILRRFLIPRRCDSALPPEPRSEEKAVAQSVSNSAAVIAPPEPKLLQLANKSQETLDVKEQQLRRRQRDSSHSPLASLVTQIQEASAGAADQVRRLSEELSELVQDGKATTSEMLESMRSEHALMLRCWAISMGGLVGYLAGLRRGAVTRLVHTATGATAIAAVCYPEEARHYNSRGLAMVRQVIVFSVDLLHNGPQISLRKDKVEVVEESEDEDLQSESTKAETNFENLSETLNPSHEQNKFKINKESSAKKKQELRWTQDSPQSYSTENLNMSTFPSNQRNDLPSAQHGSSIANSIPYSPALPASPKMKLGDNQSSKTHQNAQKPLLDNVTVTTTTENVQTSLHTYSLHDSTYHQDKNNETNTAESTNNQFYDNNSNFVIDAVPTHEKTIIEKTLKLEVDESLSKNENLRKTEQHPLNKKLNRYYVKRPDPDETLATPEKGYDDLYSKRG